MSLITAASLDENASDRERFLAWYRIPENFERARAATGHRDDVEWPNNADHWWEAFHNHSPGCYGPTIDLFNADIMATLEPVQTTEPETVTIPREDYAQLQHRASQEFSSYDERMRPMFRNAARVATNAGFCSEYDRIAAAVGAPSREDFISREYVWTVSVEVTRTMTIEVRGSGVNEDDAWEHIGLDDVDEYLNGEGIEFDLIYPEWSSRRLIETTDLDEE